MKTEKSWVIPNFTGRMSQYELRFKNPTRFSFLMVGASNNKPHIHIYMLFKFDEENSGKAGMTRSAERRKEKNKKQSNPCFSSTEQ